MDALERTYREVCAQAEALGFEASLIGRRSFNPINGEVDEGRLLKVWPKDARPNVLLELDYRDNTVCIYRHRTSELTKKFEGRAVSTAWVIKFMQANEPLARKRTAEAQEKAEAQKKELAEELEQRLLNPKPIQYRSKCRTCEGEGSWAEGSARDGDAHMVYCPVCHGAGSIPA